MWGGTEIGPLAERQVPLRVAVTEGKANKVIRDNYRRLRMAMGHQ